MGYLAAAFLAIFLIALFIKSSGFRVFVGVVFALLVAGAAYAIYYQQQETVAREKDRQFKSGLIPHANLFVQDAIAANEAGPRYFKARFHNRDGQHTIDYVRVRVTYTDCVAPGGCVVVGQSDLEMSNDIPPGQARDVSAYMMNWPTTAKGIIEWSYEITSISAK